VKIRAFPPLYTWAIYITYLQIEHQSVSPHDHFTAHKIKFFFFYAWFPLHHLFPFYFTWEIYTLPEELTFEHLAAIKNQQNKKKQAAASCGEEVPSVAQEYQNGIRGLEQWFS
jgi:hypothetical protein